MPTGDLVEQLAQEHDAHLRWLRARLHGRLAPDELEDVLQAAYARALVALSGSGRPHFERRRQATAWLRTIAVNLAHDLVRERHGRARDGRGPRPAPVRLDDAASADLIADVDVEGEVLGAADREARRRLVLEAVARLDDRHRQILQLRYGRNLSPAKIMVLVGLDRRQWDGRHTRALKALGHALARVPMSPECRRTRSLLRASPAALLRPGGGSAGDHVDSCVACAAFSRATCFAMATLPLPLPIEAWRLAAADVLASPARDSTAEAAPAVAEMGAPAEAAALAKNAVAALAASAGALATVGAFAFGGLVTGDSTATSSRPAAQTIDSTRAAPGRARSGTRLAVHLTPRQALERAAREAGRRRAAASRRTCHATPPECDAVDGPPVTGGGGTAATR